jgi:hypothetical protein
MVGDITDWYLSMKECSGVAWTGLLKAGNFTKTISELSKSSKEWHVLINVRPRMLQIGIRASFFKTKPEWDEKFELKQNVTEDLIRSGQISVVERPWKKVTTTGWK